MCLTAFERLRVRDLGVGLLVDLVREPHLLCVRLRALRLLRCPQTLFLDLDRRRDLDRLRLERRRRLTFDPQFLVLRRLDLEDLEVDLVLDRPELPLNHVECERRRDAFLEGVGRATGLSGEGVESGGAERVDGERVGSRLRQCQL